MAELGVAEVAGVAEGDVLVGKYRIDRILGTGGMGAIVAARHLQLDELVAIKFLLPEALANEEAVARFAREARAAVKIKSEHVVHVTDVGTLETGAPYMVMEYLEGCDLAAWLRDKGPLPIEQAVEFVLQACEAIAEAHGLGIVHRDLKPSNLFCIRRSDGLHSIKVLDFGISKVLGLRDSVPELSMTKTSAVIGSPLYMSPEQLRSSRDVDARTDIWAIGIILYELLVGAAPFLGQNLPEICMKIGTERAPSIRATRSEAPAALDAVIVRCLEKSRENRYPNVAELAQALSEFGPGRGRASADRISRVIRHAGLSVSSTPPPSGELEDRSGATTMSSNAPALRPSSPIRSRLTLLGIAADGFTFDAIQVGDEITVMLRGNAEMTVTARLSSSLDRLHAEIIRSGAEQVTFDLRELYFMTSSCLKCLANLLARDADLDPAQRYLVRFLANPNLHWQRRSLEALSCVSTELVRIETGP